MKALSRSVRPTPIGRTLATALLAALLTACATQPPYERPALALASAWSSGAVTAASTPVDATWWRGLHDPALSAFVESALAQSPTIAQALARLDEARAQLGVQAAQRLPTVSASAGAGRARGVNAEGTGANVASAVSYATTASIGPSLAWEVDVFGRVRQSVQASSRRLDARTADAEAVRLSLAADVVGNVLSLRACDQARAIAAQDIQSRLVGLQLTQQRVLFGAGAPVDEARARSGVASARTALVARDDMCARTVNALVALSGASAAVVRALGWAAAQGAVQGAAQATVPQAALELPAQVLLQHPAVRAADNEAAAAWADIGVARADRLPRFDLAALLSGQWLRAAGTTLQYTAWSLGASVSGSLFDGGAGAAQVDAAQARYRAAVAALRLAVRAAAEDVENALAASGSAQARAALTQDAVQAAQQTFTATQGQWRAGAVSLFELEDARRQLASARDSAVTADCDRGLAWVALVRASGNTLLNPESPTP